MREPSEASPDAQERRSEEAHDDLERQVVERTIAFSNTLALLKREIAEHERAEEAREAAEREVEAQRALSIRSDRLRSLGEMAAGIAHELNQPLTGVRGLAEYLLIALDRKWDLSEEKIKDRLRLIVEQADRMSHIIEHVRVFSREAGKHELRAVQVNEVVRSAVGMLEAQFRSRGIRLVSELTEGLPEVSANPFSLEEVVLNLLINARDAVEDRLKGGDMSGPPDVLARTWREGAGPEQRVKVEVIDRGVGISAELLGKVFDPFFTTKGPDRGTGLGLSISRSIVEEFGGAIQVRSAPGQGTTVTVSLPPEAERLLRSYDFPGNARELRNLVERAAILRRSGQILPEHLHLPKGPGDAPLASSPQPDGQAERAYLLRALEAARWNRRQAAKDLGIPYSTLRYKMQKLGIA